MSALGGQPPAPVIAPWITNYTSYPTQLTTLTGSGSGTRSITAPLNQWWRPLYFMVQYTTIAAGTARVMEVRIVPPEGNPYIQPANASQGDSAFFTYVFGVGVSAATQTAVAAFSVSVQSIPDLLWPPETVFEMIMNGANAADSYHTDPGFAFESFIEDYNNPGSFTPAPPPTIG